MTDTVAELDIIDNPGSIELLPPARPVQAAAIATLYQQAEAMQVAHQLASAIVYTSMVPDRFRGKPDEGAAAILYGGEVGLNPIQSLQNIFPVHGMPSMYARTMKALLRRHGFRFKTIEKTAAACEVHGWEPHHDPAVDDPDEVSRWTIEDAQLAEYAPVIDPETGTWKTFKKKNGDEAVLGNMKYVTNPKAMLLAKCDAEVCRNLAPDVLLGIAYSYEELTSERDNGASGAVSRRRDPTKARGVTALHDRVTRDDPVDAETVDTVESAPAQTDGSEKDQPRSNVPTTAMAASTRKKWLNRMFALLAEAECPDREDQLIVIAGLAGLDDLPEHRDAMSDEQLRTVVNALNAASKEQRLGAVVTDLLESWVARQANTETATTETESVKEN
jgi:hypothetical protein